MKTIKAKTILSKNKYPQYWFGNDYNINLYRGCHHGCIYCDSRSDCYNSFEEKESVTRNALKLIRDHHFGLSLETKSDLIVRDIDLFLDIQKYHDVIIKMTITTADDELSKIIEPHVCVSSSRFEAICKLSEAGLFVGVLMQPFYYLLMILKIIS